MIWAFSAVVLAYGIGNIPFSVIVARIAGHNVYEQGSKNPGASNVARIAGWKWGLLAMLLDILKGFIPTLSFLVISDSFYSNESSRAIAYLVGFAAMMGHVVPLGRKGGKGIATGAGVVLALLPIAGILAIMVWALTMKLFKYPVVSSITAALVLPIWVGLYHYYRWEFFIVTLLFVFVVGRHAPNLMRLIRREENTVSRKTEEL